MKQKPMTIYPDSDMRRAVEQISEADHDRPQSKVVELAIKAFAVMWEQDRWNALKLAAEFDAVHK